MRTSILLWSALSGAVLGVLVDAALIGLALLLSAIVPSLAGKIGHRWIATLAAVLLAAIPIASAFVGFLEGRLKAG